MWNPFKQKTVPPVVLEPPTKEPTSHVFNGNMVLKKPVVEGNWRQGMWVMVGDKIGILHKMDAIGNEVHFVDQESGDTILIDYVNFGLMRQARYAEIPEIRKAGFPLEVAKGYGYGN